MTPAGLVLLAALLQAPSTVDTSTQPPTVKVSAKTPANDPDRIVCRTENPTGSNIPSRVCHTARQWDESQAGGQKMLNDMNQQSLHSSLSGH